MKKKKSAMIVFVSLIVVSLVGCQESEREQMRSQIGEQSVNDESMTRKNNKELEDLMEITADEISQMEIFINSSTAKGKEILVKDSDKIGELWDLLFVDKQFQQIESTYDKNRYDFQVSILVTTNQNESEAEDIFFFDPNVIMYDSLFYEVEESIEYSFIKEMIENSNTTD